MTERPSADTAAGVRSRELSRPSTEELELIDLRADFDMAILSALYGEILAPSFAVEELDPLETIADGLTSGNDPATYGIVALQRGRAIGVVVAEHHRASDVLLIAYLAVAEQLRGRGIGAQLLADAASRWYDVLGAALVLAEVHDPRRYAAVEGLSAWRRLTFFDRAGARALDMPFIQPSLTPRQDRVRDLLLLTFHVAPRAMVITAGAPCVDGKTLRGFIRRYYVLAEGELPAAGDHEYWALESPLDHPVRLIPVQSIISARDTDST